MGILVENVSKQFGSFKAVDQIDLEIKSGSLVTLLGPSGSGKSTLLRLIAGLETPDSGRILLEGKDSTYQSVQERNIGFAFQSYDQSGRTGDGSQIEKKRVKKCF